MTLTDFLLARIAEDEAAAKTAAELGGAAWKAFHTLNRQFEEDQDEYGIWFVGGEYILWETEGSSFMGGYWQHMNHIATWDPARVLAECEAKRRIIAEHRPTTLDDENEADEWQPTPLQILRMMALPYADRPDYKQEWRI